MSRYREEVTDPVTGETVVFTADTEAELDAQVNARFEIDDAELVAEPKSPR